MVKPAQFKQKGSYKNECAMYADDMCIDGSPWAPNSATATSCQFFVVGKYCPWYDTMRRNRQKLKKESSNFDKSCLKTVKIPGTNQYIPRLGKYMLILDDTASEFEPEVLYHGNNEKLLHKIINDNLKRVGYAGKSWDYYTELHLYVNGEIVKTWS